ncbi:TylF/MycF/NovP-related O-methyltransferase [Paraburkholderia tropica]|uniref:TylF/MycF/NovP-related O-methyltransferase n=1 Tax=Paraburkholderia tropica TaxID=92647 RepID=UPI002ABD4C45|nr:TylF/MycF/NovP-related O-methyltransferase [Paraburkholderia tropica]
MAKSTTLTSNWEDLLISKSPQKYTDNVGKYKSRGGIIEPQTDILKFSHNDKVRFFAFCLILDQLVKDNIQGDFVELGVFKGHSAQFLAAVGRRLGRVTYLMDTFEGFNAKDLSEDESQLKGAFADTSLDAVRARVGDEQTVFIKGHFPDSAAQLPGGMKYSLVHIDCDLGEPMAAGLKYFYPRMQPGGFLIMHDYNSLYWDGAELAVDNFFSDKPEGIVPLPDFCGSVVVRKSKDPYYE